MTWVKEPPYVPEKGKETIFYWYYDNLEDEIWPTKVYKGHWILEVYKGLWWDKPIKPPTKPKKSKK
jgi:hypothetical protein